ncbi:hypothetical protein UlMin_008522 [Ulmus minor]
MAYNEESCSSQLIDGDGGFNVTGIDSFIKEVKLADCGLLLCWKSTLLNHLFDTNFREMDAFKGRSQTTKGIWLARCAGIEPCTLVMDLEGTYGRERGESALFALAVSDVVLINMWCHDIGREQAANKPLLKFIFQVMMRLFSPRKTTLMFVIHDKTRTPLENLEPVLREDIQKIWDSVPKPQAHIETPLSEFFNVEVVALSSYEEKEEQFKEQVANLRQRFFHSIAPGGLTEDRRGVVPASGFSFSAQQIWKVIKENKDLDLPAHKVMVATVRCEEIASEKFFSFSGNEDWRELEEAVQSGPISGFGKKLSSVLGTCLSEYDTEATYFDEGVRSAKRKQLEEKLLQLVQPAFQDLLGHLRSGTLDKFKEAFDKAMDSGEGFAAVARECTQSYMALFDDEEEELKELKGTATEMSSETGEAAVQKLQEEIKFCKSILQCLVYRWKLDIYSFDHIWCSSNQIRVALGGLTPRVLESYSVCKALSYFEHCCLITLVTISPMACNVSLKWVHPPHINSILRNGLHQLITIFEHVQLWLNTQFLNVTLGIIPPKTTHEIEAIKYSPHPKNKEKIPPKTTHEIEVIIEKYNTIITENQSQIVQKRDNSKICL